jgi:hypothetical protein
LFFDVVDRFFGACFFAIPVMGMAELGVSACCGVLFWYAVSSYASIYWGCGLIWCAGVGCVVGVLAWGCVGLGFWDVGVGGDVLLGLCLLGMAGWSLVSWVFWVRPSTTFGCVIWVDEPESLILAQSERWRHA